MYAPLFFPAHLGYMCPKAKSTGPRQLSLVPMGSGCMNALEREPEHHMLTPCKGTVTFHIGFQGTANGIVDTGMKEGEVLFCSITLSLIRVCPVTCQP